MHQIWGKKADDLLKPGYHLCWCTFKRHISCVISKNTIRYNCPITDIPTKDNVMVSIDMGINFHIGDDSNYEKLKNDMEKFFYNFGPNRLEELLEEESDEAIREFVKNVRVSRIRDIKTELCTVIKDTL